MTRSMSSTCRRAATRALFVAAASVACAACQSPSPSADSPAPGSPAEKRARPASPLSGPRTAYASPNAPAPTTAPRTLSPVVTTRPAVGSIDELQRKPLYGFNEYEVDAYLRHLHRTEPDLRRRLAHLGRKNIGQPYQIFLLGEFPYELYDADPMYCLTRSDCVTFSEHTYAMALGHDWPSFFALLQRLRYKDGRVGMVTRNHETITEWDRNNAWLFEDVTKTLGGGTAWITLHGEWKPAEFFAQFGIGQDRPDVEIVDAYIPRDRIASIEPELMDGDFVNIIRGDDKLQYAGHTGLIVHGEDGVVHFLHSSKPQVREEPLQAYLNANAKTLGMKFLRLRPDAEARAARMLSDPASHAGP